MSADAELVSAVVALFGIVGVAFRDLYQRLAASDAKCDERISRLERKRRVPRKASK